MDAQVAHHALNLIILQIAIAAVNLQRLIGNIEAPILYLTHCHCRFTDLLSLTPLQRARRLIQHQPRRFQLGRHIGQLKLNGLKFGN